VSGACWIRHPRLLAAATVLACAACGPRPSPSSTPAAASASQAPQSVTLSIVATTDLHGHIEALPWLSGYVRIIRKARASDGAALLVDAGDMFQGTLESNLSEGEAVVQAYNALGYTAAAVGNHEFDYGPEGPAAVPRSPNDDPRGALKARARDARFPLLAANLTSNDPAWAQIPPSIVVEAAGVKVGILGVTTSRTLEATHARNVVGMSVTPVAATIEAQARTLRAQGADLVVALAHAGGGCRTFGRPDDVSGCEAREIFTVARQIPAGLVDVIAAGHTHRGIAHRVNGIAIVQAFAEGRAFSRIDLVVDATSRTIRDSRIFPPHSLCNGRDIEESASTAERQPGVATFAPDACTPAPYEGEAVVFDAALAERMQAHVARAKALREKPLGITAATPFTPTLRSESPLGNLVADLMRAARPNVQAAIYNGGGLRAPLPAGSLTYGDLYALLPFDNVLATTDTTAGAIGRVLARAVRAGSLPALSGIKADVRCETGGLRVTLSSPDGRPLSDDTRLQVLATDFLASGGDGFFTDTETPFTVEPGPPMRDVVADVLSAQRGPLRADDPKLFDAARPRISLPGPVPVRCE
jgi:2',3'-cyclic-nucleotide 2'-phosphodiesterase (5'-nucleotidase family)